MSFVTMPSVTLVKGQSYEVFLDKAALVLEPPVAADSYFSDNANWDRVELIFKSTNSDQLTHVFINPNVATPVGALLVSEQGIAAFKILEVRIYDFDGGTFILEYGDFDTAQFQVDWDMKIAPANKIVAKTSDHNFTMEDATYYEVGFTVRLWNSETNVFEGGNRTILVSDSNTHNVQVNTAFDVAIIPDKHYLRFSKFQDCKSGQQTNYYYNP